MDELIGKLFPIHNLGNGDNITTVEILKMHKKPGKTLNMYNSVTM